MSFAYYNENDPYAAQWLRNLIEAGHIALGFVDERDIKDVKPDEIREFTQCHFFAGIGVWSYALRAAGWPDDRPVWTGSCPCQPFSAAGAGLGFADERHLWPHWFHLINECRPATVLGEQVASKDVDPWIDLVQDDMEALGHAFGAIAFPAASVGAPHIRDRTYWMAHAMREGSLSGAYTGIHRNEESTGSRHGESERSGAVLGMGNASGERLEGHPRHDRAAGREGSARSVAAAGVLGGLADASDVGLDGRWPSETSNGRDATRLEPERLRFVERVEPAGPTNGFWRDADWLYCRDGKWRPVKPGAFPLVDGAAARVGRLRAYGNAINAEAAIEFVRCAAEAIEEIT